MNYKYLVFGHCDLDQLGCNLLIKTQYKDVKVVSTNYINFIDKFEEFKDVLFHNSIEKIFITDVSFANFKEQFDFLSSLNVQVVFIDHHIYPEDFFNDTKIKVIHDISKSASLLTLEYFGRSKFSADMNTLIDIINVYDLFLLDDKYYHLSSFLNEYFWTMTRTSQNIEMIFLKNPNISENVNFIKFCSISKVKNAELLAELERKKLILRHLMGTIAFSNEIYDLIVLNEFKANKHYVIIASFNGIVRIRFNLSLFTDSKIKSELRKQITGLEYIGHENAFSIKVEQTQIIQKVKEIDGIIHNRLKGLQ